MRTYRITTPTTSPGYTKRTVKLNMIHGLRHPEHRSRTMALRGGHMQGRRIPTGKGLGGVARPTGTSAPTRPH